MRMVAETLGVARSNLHDRVQCPPKSRGPYRKPEDVELLPMTGSFGLQVPRSSIPSGSCASCRTNGLTLDAIRPVGPDARTTASLSP